MTEWGCSRLPWKHGQLPPPLHTSTQGEQIFASTKELIPFPSGLFWEFPLHWWSGRATGRQNSREGAGWQGAQEALQPEGASPISGRKGRGTVFILRQPKHILRPGCSQRRHWTVLLCFWGCYDSQEFANQTGPGEEFCPWPQKFVVPNCLLRVPAVYFDTCQMEGSRNLGSGNIPVERLLVSWMKLH